MEPLMNLEVAWNGQAGWLIPGLPGRGHLLARAESSPQSIALPDYSYLTTEAIQAYKRQARTTPRRVVYDVVRADRWLCTAEIAKLVGRPYGVVVNHLRRLSDTGKLERRDTLGTRGTRLCMYFKRGSSAVVIEEPLDPFHTPAGREQAYRDVCAAVPAAWTGPQAIGLTAKVARKRTEAWLRDLVSEGKIERMETKNAHGYRRVYYRKAA